MLKVLRALPPVSAAPLSAQQLWRGLCGLWADRDLCVRRREEFAAYLGLPHVFPVSSGKAALYLALKALQQCAPGTEVVVPAYTCFSVPSAIVKAGLRVVPCDVDPESYDFDYDRLGQAITPQTLCIVTTHLLGIPADTERVRKLAAERGVFVIEDAAQAFGVKRGGRYLGTGGDVGIFSFGRGKQVTCGSGGMVVTGREEIARILDPLYEALPEESFLESVIEWGLVAAMQMFLRTWLYWIPARLPFLKLGQTVFDPGFPVRKLSLMKAGLLEAWKQALDQGNAIRQFHVQRIVSQLQGTGMIWSGLPLLRVPVLCRSQTHRHHLKEACQAMGLGSLYPSGVNMIPALGGSHDPGEFAGAAMVAERLVTLPTHHLMSTVDLCELVSQLRKAGEGTGPDDSCRAVDTFISGNP